MVAFNGLVTCIVAALVCLSFVCGDKLRLCVVDGKGGFKISNRYCPSLADPASKVECVIGLDRLDCLRQIAKGTVDFTVLTPEDLVTAHTSEIEILITNELRYTQDKYEYEVVAVVNRQTGIKSKHQLKGRKYCHPGYGYEGDWTRILANYFEASVVPQMCNPKLTLTENRIKATSEFFKSSCKAGPWVRDLSEDEQLKIKYPNLCELCGSPVCSTNDKYWGRRGPLLCLTDGAGDISWARWDDVQIHFGLTPGGTEASPDDYYLLCPNDSIMPLNTTNPCVWVVKPWPVVATKRTAAQDVQAIVSKLTTQVPWQLSVLNILSAATSIVENLRPIEAIETYLNRATGYLSANSFSGCHPPRTIKICTTSIIENAKCSWLRESAAVYGIEPDLDCIKADNKTHCMLALNTPDAADVMMVPPDLYSTATRKYNLKPLFYETVTDTEKYLVVAITKKGSSFSKLKDLKGAKSCFPNYDGVAWHTVYRTLQNKGLASCSVKPGDEYFGPSCVPGFPLNGTLSELCGKNKYVGDYGAIDCIVEGSADVAFVSKNSLYKYLKDNPTSQLNDFKILCEDPAGSCHLSWSPIAYGMVRANSTDVWMKDTLDVFLQLDVLFGRNYKSLTNPLTLYGSYNGKSNVLFQDATARLREIPIAKNIDSMDNEFEDLINKNEFCLLTSHAVSLQCSFIALFIAVISKYLFV